MHYSILITCRVALQAQVALDSDSDTNPRVGGLCRDGFGLHSVDVDYVGHRNLHARYVILM
jgi:hypothetical protein